ncbi:RNA polymerase [Streptomyces sp. SL13]|uniref:RNA polymerase n=1 Tax=Streptantibioticus silvisoli TaxID=2705255 RepID=A0AA90KG42_9ACTN|nr:RNA polymerase [Streptantibioticus silvisoli]MDI5966881.1 RNA polymerase [Streptantibioticus silvisoli]MDI5970110.1 RNA polymerase [Streptantibioticus silvisoli]
MVSGHREIQERRRAREFEAFTAGAGGRLLHAATLLTGDPAEGERLLVAALASTFADWFRLHGEDPYVRTRQDLAERFTRAHRRYRRPRGGVLDRLPPAERLALVLRVYEGIAEEQSAAQLGMPTERMRTNYLRAVALMRSRRP